MNKVVRNLIALAILSVSAQAGIIVPEGTFYGVGTWESTSGASGVMELSWTQAGNIGTNHGVLKMGAGVAAEFNDSYLVEEVTGTTSQYTIKRLVNNTPVLVGNGVNGASNYVSSFSQDGRYFEEFGVVNTTARSTSLLRVGQIKLEDGSTIMYNATLTLNKKKSK